MPKKPKQPKKTAKKPVKKPTLKDDLARLTKPPGQLAVCGQDQWCRTMAVVLNETDDRMAGLSVANFYRGNGDLIFTSVVYRKRRGDAGVLLNHCPWCGEAIDFWKAHGTKNTRPPIVVGFGNQGKAS